MNHHGVCTLAIAGPMTLRNVGIRTGIPKLGGKCFPLGKIQLLGAVPSGIHLLVRVAGVLVLCIRGMRGKGTLRMYPSFRVPTM